MNGIISTSSLTKIYGEKETSVKALDNVDVEFKENQFTAIMGPSGSGKSTLIRHINRLIDPTAGEVIVNNVDVCNT